MEQVAGQAVPPKIEVRKEKTLNQSYWKRYGVFYLMMAPALIVLIINNYIPMVGSLIAFKSMTYASPSFFQNFVDSPWIGWKNFEFLFNSSDAWLITRNTLAYNAVFIVLNLVVGVALALMFHNLRNKKLAKFYQTTMFLPYFLSMIIVAYLAYGFLNPDIGVMNKLILPWFGNEEGVMWYSDPKWWPLILPIVNTWKFIGYYAVFYLAAIIGIDNEYYEAAHIDGATRWRQVWTITLPLIKPVIIILTLLQIGRIFYADFGLFFQVTQNAGALYEKTLIIDTYVFQGFRATGDIGMSSAAGLYQAVVGFVLVFASNLIVRRISKEDALF
ncbi:ABC transporter permease subunit [Cohnella sp. CFH 77786]|uniref:ABC transporter permease n=1 Tax=Cohnella sp. CFH 77786 TaxID=2662265 RepID=UPI001EC5265D|nr:ABC transporter permease subunit [Cohnella sp. CFH 77786]MBW5445750.1 ABC transporter permease subunit [Cohnella sp. CFH 77786]